MDRCTNVSTCIQLVYAGSGVGVVSCDRSFIVLYRHLLHAHIR